MFGIDEFTAVINPPEGAILGVGAMTPRAIVRDHEADRKTMRVTMSCDHRVIDGAVGAQSCGPSTDPGEPLIFLELDSLSSDGLFKIGTTPDLFCLDLNWSRRCSTALIQITRQRRTWLDPGPILFATWPIVRKIALRAVPAVALVGFRVAGAL